ncbi:wHTH domain-containing protein [Streptomyces sp. NPDC001414]
MYRIDVSGTPPHVVLLRTRPSRPHTPLSGARLGPGWLSRDNDGQWPWVSAAGPFPPWQLVATQGWLNNSANEVRAECVRVGFSLLPQAACRVPPDEFEILAGKWEAEWSSFRTDRAPSLHRLMEVAQTALARVPARYARAHTPRSEAMRLLVPTCRSSGGGGADFRRGHSRLVDPSAPGSRCAPGAGAGTREAVPGIVRSAAGEPVHAGAVVSAVRAGTRRGTIGAPTAP